MKVNFYIRPSKTALKPIKMFISLKGSRYYLHTNFHIEEKKWDKKKQRVNLKYSDAGIINPRLVDLEELAFKLHAQHLPQSAIDLIKLIEASLFPAEERKEIDVDIFAVYDLYIKDSKTRINDKKVEVLAERSIAQYESAKETLIRFRDYKLKDNPNYQLTFKTFDNIFYSEYRAFCLEEEDLSPNTFGGKIKRLKGFLTWCLERDYPITNKFMSYQVPQSYQEADPLTGKELIKLWEINIGKDQWKLDTVLALCSSGMRISDFNLVMPNMDKYVKQTLNGKALVFNAKKTGAKCIVPMYDDQHFRINYLYQKYSGKMKSISGQKLNEWMKESGLFKRIPEERQGSKIGRITLCSIKYFELGIEAQHIMPVTGHKTEGEFKKYLGANANTILKANKEKSTHLKVS